MGIADALERWLDTMDALSPTFHAMVAYTWRYPVFGAVLWAVKWPGPLPFQAYNRPNSVTALGILDFAIAFIAWSLLCSFTWRLADRAWDWIPLCHGLFEFMNKRWPLRALWPAVKDTYFFPKLWKRSISLLRFLQRQLDLRIPYLLALFRPPASLCLRALISAIRRRYGSESGRMETEKVPKPYQYRPLLGPRAIRLLVWPRRTIFGHDAMPTLVHRTLDGEEYDCVSYFWGMGPKDSHIAIDGEYLAVTRNVTQILASLQSISKPRKWWIDAICINQGDGQGAIQEKTHQVRMMADIYRKAQRVVVWLGEGELVSGIEATLLLKELQWVGKYYHRTPSLASTRRFAAPFYHRRWQALSALLRHKWFERVWTIQEVVVASKVEVYYAGTSIDWQVLVDVMTFLKSIDPAESLETFLLVSEGRDWYDARFWSHLRSSPEGFRRVGLISIIRDTLLKNERKFTLRHILMLLAKAKATKACDMVFAVQGLITDDKAGMLAPDYAATDEEVFIRAATYFLYLDRPLKILAFAGLSEGKFSNLPSWVPDLNQLPHNFGLALNADDPAIYHASANSSPKTHLSSDFRILTTSGSIVDRILSIGSIFNLSQPENGIDQTERFQQMADSINEARKLVWQIRPKPSHRQSNDEALWRTLSGDRDLHYSLRPLPMEYIVEGLTWERHFGELREFLRQNPEIYCDRKRLKESLARGVEPECLKQYRLLTDNTVSMRVLSAFAAAAQDRRFCTTARGHIGLVPATTKAGDSVAIIMGAETPFILRKDGDAAQVHAPQTEIEAWLLIGECYMDGMMDGEMMRDAYPGNDIILR